MFDETLQKEFREQCAHTRARLLAAGVKGPWCDEPDRVEWEHDGLVCLALRNSKLFHWCGYVGLPPGHKLYGRTYSEIYGHSDFERPELADLRVHGGLTYSEGCQGPICHKPKPGEPDELFWLGFDCTHYGDLSPGMEMIERLNNLPHFTHGQYRDLAYVRAEVNGLAEQLARIA